MLRDLPSTPGQPCITRFVINRVTMNVNYTIEGYGQIVKGLASPGTTPLRLMLQFLADYAPPDLEVVPECLAELQAHCEVAVEWEMDSGTVFENGATSVFRPREMVPLRRRTEKQLVLPNVPGWNC